MEDIKVFKQGDIVSCDDGILQITVLVSNGLGRNDNTNRFKGVVLKSNSSLYHVGEYSESWYYNLFNIAPNVYLSLEVSRK